MEFWFDDGYEADYSKTLPFLMKNSCTGISAIVTDLICKPGYMCLKKVSALVGCGWKIASHGTNHKCMLDMSVDETERVLVDSKKWIEKNLGVVPRMFVAPWNVMHAWQRELALVHYLLVRSPKELHFHSNNFTDVKNTINKFLKADEDTRQGLVHYRYLKSRRVIKNRFGVDV